MILLALAVSQILSAEAAQIKRAIPAPPQIPPCALERGSVLVNRKADLPGEAIVELARLFANGHGLAEAGEYFGDTDAPINDAPDARFIRGYHVQDVWFIWYERSGRSTLALAPQRDRTTGATVFRVVPGSHFVGDLCAGTKAFLSGARSAG